MNLANFRLLNFTRTGSPNRFLLCLFLCIVAFPTCASAQQSQISVLLSAKSELDSILIAVNAHDKATVLKHSTATEPGAFDWLRHKKQNWQADLLKAPKTRDEASKLGSVNTPPDYSLLAVFHSWHSCESDGDHVYHFESTSAGWKLGSEILEEDTTGLRVRDHDIHVSISVPTKIATLSDRLKVERTSETAPLYSLLRISQDYKLSSLVKWGDRASQKLAFTQVGGIVLITPPTDKNFELFANYSGKLANTNGDYIHEDEAVINSYWYLHSARLPATLTVTATAPAGWTALGQGELVSSSKSKNGSRIVTFRNDIPTTFFTVDFGMYEIISRKVGNKTLTTYLLPNEKRKNSTTSKTSLDLLEQAMAWYEKSFAPFPYSRYGIVETRGPFGGALEAYSFATFVTGSFNAIPHELAHTWWGGTVPCDYIHSMWNEGFASYSDNLFSRMTSASPKVFDPNKIDPKSRMQAVRGLEKAFNALALLRAYDTEDGVDGTIGYGKGEMVLRVLEDEIGQERMLKSMRTFFHDHKRGEIATWKEFEAAVRKATGADYRWFFEQWVDNAGMPKVRTTNLKVTLTDGKKYLEGNLIQEGTPYRMTLRMAVENKNGSAEKFKLDVTGETTRFHQQISGEPSRLWLDPDNLIPLAPASTVPPDASAFVVPIP